MVKVIRVASSAVEFDVPDGYEPFFVLQNIGEWLVFLKKVTR